MFQLMTEQLAGFLPLQRIILHDFISYGTPSSRAMRPIIEEVQQRIRANPDKPADEMTAWRCQPKQPMSNLGHFSFRGFVMATELDLLRISSVWENTDPALIVEKTQILALVQYSDLDMKYKSLL